MLGNALMLHDHRDTKARAEIVGCYRTKYEDDLRHDDPMAAAREALAGRIRNGEFLAPMCWRRPKPRYDDLIIVEINRRHRSNPTTPELRPLGA
jgi:hypothetical protein